MSLNQVNVAVVENNTIVKSDVLRAEKAGSAVKIKAVKGGKYILAQGEKGYAPENITVKRVGKDLHVMLEGTDENQPQMIIEDFFENPGELVGKAEDGQWHEFISSDGDSDHQAAFLMDGESSALVLGAGAIGALDSLMVAPFALSPALLALGALAGLVAAAGLATAIAHNRDKGGDNGDDGNGGSGGGGGNDTVFTPELSGVTDNVGDFTGPIQNGGLTDDSTPTFGGTGTPGNVVIIRDNGEEIGSVIVGEDGKWEFTPEVPLEDGEHKFELVERDDKGNESAPGEEFVVIVDTEAPAKPEMGQVFDDVEPKTGPVSNGGTTNDETPTFSGGGQTLGDTIIIIDNGKEIGSVIVGQDGSWEFTPDQPLDNGEHSVEIVARDPAGNRSEPSDPWLVIVDTEIPGKPGTGTTPGLDDIIDDVGSVTGSIADGSTTDDTKPTLEGSHQKPGTIVTIIDNGTPIGSVVADENGGWQFTPATDLPEGDHQFSIIIETPNGYVSPESDPWLVIVDTTAPAAPVITDIIDDQGAVTGAISDGDTTDDAQPEIRGTAEAGSTVIIYDKGVAIGSAMADANGDWSFTPVPPLLNGDHAITAKAQDAAGNLGDESNSIGFDLIAGGNATAPAIIGAWDNVEGKTGMLHNGELTNDARPELRGTAQPGDVVTIVLDGKTQGSVTADANGQWSWTPAAELSEGVHNFRAEVADAAGNKTATGNFQLELDLTKPDAADDLTAEDNVGPITGTINPGDTTDDSTPTFGGTGEPGDTVIVKDGDDIIGTTIVKDDGSWEFTPDQPLDDGKHSIIVIIEDPAGNQSDESAPIEFIVDTDNVIVSIDYAVDDVVANTGNMSSGSVTNDDTPTLYGKATANSIVTIMDGTTVLGSVKTDSFGRWSFTTPSLAEGEHKLTAIATDAKTGVISAPTAEFVLDIDTSAPTKPGEGGTGGDGIGDVIDDVGPIKGSVGNGDTTDDATPTLEGSGLQPGDIVTIIDNGQPIGSAVADENGGWQFTPNTPLNEGDHSFTVIVTDPAGNSSEESNPYVVVVDTTAPAEPVITSVIDDQGAVTGPVASGDTIDDAQPEIAGTAEANSVVIIFDNGIAIGSAQADANGDWSFTPTPPLLNGDHSITAKAQDAAGNIGDASNNFDFELIAGGNATAPSIIGAWDDVEGNTGLLHNGELTNDARPELRGTAQPGDVVTIILDGKAQGSVTADANGQWSWTPVADLSEGVHNFRAEVADAAGNKTATGNFQLELDLTKPDAADDLSAGDNVGPITGTINPGDTTDDSTPTFDGTGEPGDTVIVKDGDDIIGTTIVKDDGSWEFTPDQPLDDGKHSIIVIIEDPAGNQSDESAPIEFIVDTDNVIVSIDYAVDDVVANTGNMSSGTITNDDTPTLNGKATANSIVTIMDGTTVLGSVKTDSFGRWTFTTSSLAEGEHKFTAIATDAKTGVISAPTAEFVLDIDTTAPTKPGDGGTGGDGIGVVIDDVGPIKGSVGNGDTTDDTTPTLEGSGLQPGDVVTIIDNGTPVGSAVADNNGGWKFTPDTPLNDGDHEFTIIVTDPAGNSSEESDSYLVVVDTEAPAAPVITSIVDDLGAVTGPINNGDVTDDAQPVISGTAEANSTVIIYDKGVEIGRADVDASGNWSFTPVPPLLNGDHEITAKAQDAAGNIGDESNSIGFELIAGGIPGAPAIIGAWDDVEGHTGMLHNGDLTNDATPELRGTAPAGKVVTISVDGVVQGSVTADVNGQWSWTPAAELAEGSHTFRAEIIDAAGNTLGADFALELDLTKPDAADDTSAEDNVGDITGPILDDGTTDDSTPTFGGTGEPGDKVIIKDGDDIIGTTIVKDDGSWEFTPEDPLDDGLHNIIVIIEDPAGNQSDDSAPIEFIVDTGNVVVSIDYAVDDVAAITGNMASGAVTNDDTPTLHGKATPNTLVTILDGNTVLGSAQVDSFGRWSFTTPVLAEGVHDLTAKVTDKAGNAVTTAEFILEIDITASVNNGIDRVLDDVGVIQGTISDGDSTDDTTPTLTGNSQTPGDVVTVTMDGKVIGSAVVDKNGDWRFTPDTPLTEGAHEFTTIVTDQAGNSSAESDPFNLVIDTMVLMKPTITDIWDDQGSKTGTITKGSATDDNQPDLTGTSTANSIVIIYDNGTLIGSAMADANGNWSFTPSRPMANGTHLVTVVAQSAAGNQSEPSDGWNFSVSTGGAPGAPAIVSVYDNVDPLQGYLSKGQTTNDTRPTLAGTANPGNIVVVYDGANNTTPLGSAVVKADGSWSIELTSDLSEGSHNLWVAARDSVGNWSISSGTWKVIIDTVAPGAVSGESLTDDVGAITGPITSGTTTDDSTPTFSGKAEPGAIVIIKDNGIEIGSAQVDANGDWSFTPAPALVDGSHSFTATPVDAAGNEGPESTPVNFDVNTSAVQVTIDSALDNAGIYTGALSNGAVTDDTTPTLMGKATANEVVFIYQNGGATAIGSSTADANGNWSFTVPTLTEGNYTFQAGVDDGNGTEVLTGEFALIVDLTAPVKPLIDDVEDDVGKIKGTVANGGITDDSTPTLSGKGVAGDLVSIRKDGVVIGSTLVRADGTWNFTPSTSPLNDGTHRLSVVMTDAAGNASQASDDWVITVDTLAPKRPTIDSVYDDFGSKTGNIADGGRTDDQTPTLRGSAEPNSIVSIYDGNKLIGSVTTNASGKWAFTTPTLPTGSTHQFSVHASDAAGNNSGKSNTFNINIGSDSTSGYEPFDEFGVLSIPNNSSLTFSSGLIITGHPDSYSSLSNTLYHAQHGYHLYVSGRGPIKLDIGSAEQVSFQIVGPYLGVKVFDVNGNVILDNYTSGLGQYSNLTRVWSFTSPGAPIAYLEFSGGSNNTAVVDALSWGPKVTRLLEVNPEDEPTALNAQVDDWNLDSSHSILNAGEDNYQPQTQYNIIEHQLIVSHAKQPLDFNSVVVNDMNVSILDMTNSEANVLNISLGDILTHGEEHAFTADETKQLMVKGDAGDVVNLTDLLPDGTDPGNWAKAEGTVTVGGVQYEVYQHSGADTELLVQLGVQTNLNNH